MAGSKKKKDEKFFLEDKKSENRKDKEEKKPKNEEAETQEKSLNKKRNQQMIWAILLMVALILIIILVPYVWQNYVNKFVYLKLDFQKTKLGELKFYSTRVPITNKQNAVIGSYSMNFRNDPRQLDYINFTVKNDLVTFKMDKTVYISLDPNMERCEDNSIAFINLAGFLRDFAGLKIKSAVSDEKYGKENNISYVTCKNSKNSTVIFITSGNNTYINETSEDCYWLVYNNCESLQVTEKFMLEIIEDYMSYFVREN